MVKEKWSSWSDRIFSSKLDGVIIKLSLLKNEVSVWEKAKKREERRRLEEIDTEMQMLMGMVDELFFSFDRKNRIDELEAARDILLKHREETLW